MNKDIRQGLKKTQISVVMEEIKTVNMNKENEEK